MAFNLLGSVDCDADVAQPADASQSTEPRRLKAIIHYLNNCKNFDHPQLYGPEAIYDLWTTGRDKSYVKGFSVGDECIVASKVKKKSAYNPEDVVKLASFTFAGFKPGKYTKDGAEIETIVLCGSLNKSVQLPKSEAATNKRYSIFFNSSCPDG